MTFGRNLAGLVLVGLAGMTGLCVYESNRDPSGEVEKEPEPMPKYFAEIPVGYRSGMAMISGDFDGDGDLDFIVGAHNGSGVNANGRLYHFDNDGEGNFTLREPER